jgi:hypothetical protein
VLSSTLRARMGQIERELTEITQSLHRVIIADSIGRAQDRSAGDLLTVVPDLLQSALKRVQVMILLYRVFCALFGAIRVVLLHSLFSYGGSGRRGRDIYPR